MAATGTNKTQKRNLFEPWTLKNVTFPNRFVLPGMQRGWAVQYQPSDKLNAYYTRCVRGGIGLVITESVAVNHPSATSQPGTSLMMNETTAPAWKACIEAIHRENGRVFVQLWHEGAIRKENAAGLDPSYPTLSPSGLIRKGHPNGRAATVEELDSIRTEFVKAAVLAKSLGVDGIEVHGAHGYFIDLFLWADTNTRNDKYGERSRYPAEIVESIRKAVGEDFIISFRLSQWKEVDYNAKIAHTPDELKALLGALGRAGVDVFHVSTRRFNRPEWPAYSSDLSFAGWVKSITNTTVIAVGSVGLNIDLMDTIYTDQPIVTHIESDMAKVQAGLDSREFDLIAVGRSVLADQAWVQKVFEGRFSDIIPFNREMLTEVLDEWDGEALISAHQG